MTRAQQIRFLRMLLDDEHACLARYYDLALDDAYIRGYHGHPAVFQAAAYIKALYDAMPWRQERI